MCKLVIQRKYGHPKAGHETFAWEKRDVVVKEQELTNEDLLAQAQAAFTEAMNETGAFAMMKLLPTDKEYIPTDKFNPNAYELFVMPGVMGG